MCSEFGICLSETGSANYPGYSWFSEGYPAIYPGVFVRVVIFSDSGKQDCGPGVVGEVGRNSGEYSLILLRILDGSRNSGRNS